jgi:hypothetical protein
MTTPFPTKKTLAQTSELVPGGVLGVRNPNLRSKIAEKRPPEAKQLGKTSTTRLLVLE